MKPQPLFFLIALVVVANAVYWPARWAQSRLMQIEGSRVREALTREADLVEHFCLTGYAPMPGRSAIPAQWEKALGSSIRLRDNVAEVVSEAPGLMSKADEIRNLRPGGTLYARMSGPATVHVVVRRPASAPNQFLFLSKDDLATGEHLRARMASPLLVAMLVALASASLLTIARAILQPRSSPR